MPVSSHTQRPGVFPRGREKKGRRGKRFTQRHKGTEDTEEKKGERGIIKL